MAYLTILFQFTVTIFLKSASTLFGLPKNVCNVSNALYTYTRRHTNTHIQKNDNIARWTHRLIPRMSFWTETTARSTTILHRWCFWVYLHRIKHHESPECLSCPGVAEKIDHVFFMCLRFNSTWCLREDPGSKNQTSGSTSNATIDDYLRRYKHLRYRNPYGSALNCNKNSGRSLLDKRKKSPSQKSP